MCGGTPEGPQSILCPTHTRNRSKLKTRTRKNHFNSSCVLLAKIKKNQRIKKRIKFCRCPICWARERETHTVASTHTHTQWNAAALPTWRSKAFDNASPHHHHHFIWGWHGEIYNTKNGIEDKLDWRFFWGSPFFKHEITHNGRLRLK